MAKEVPLEWKFGNYQVDEVMEFTFEDNSAVACNTPQMLIGSKNVYFFTHDAKLWIKPPHEFCNIWEGENLTIGKITLHRTQVLLQLWPIFKFAQHWFRVKRVSKAINDREQAAWKELEKQFTRFGYPKEKHSEQIKLFINAVLDYNLRNNILPSEYNHEAARHARSKCKWLSKFTSVVSGIPHSNVFHRWIEESGYQTYVTRLDNEHLKRERSKRRVIQNAKRKEARRIAKEKKRLEQQKKEEQERAHKKWLANLPVLHEPYLKVWGNTEDGNRPPSKVYIMHDKNFKHQTIPVCEKHIDYVSTLSPEEIQDIKDLVFRGISKSTNRVDHIKLRLLEEYLECGKLISI